MLRLQMRNRAIPMKWVMLLCMWAILSRAASAHSLTVGLGAASVTWSTAFGNALVPGSATNPGNRTIAVTTTWTNISPSANGITLWAYFNTSIALAHTTCTGTCPDIPSSAFQIGVNGGALTPVNNAGFFSANSLQIFNVQIFGFNKNGNRTDTLNFNINLSSLSQLSPDTYTGTLVIQAHLTP